MTYYLLAPLLYHPTRHNAIPKTQQEKRPRTRSSIFPLSRSPACVPNEGTTLMTRRPLSPHPQSTTYVNPSIPPFARLPYPSPFLIFSKPIPIEIPSFRLRAPALRSPRG